MKPFARKHKFLAGVAALFFVAAAGLAGVLISTSAQSGTNECAEIGCRSRRAGMAAEPIGTGSRKSK